MASRAIRTSGAMVSAAAVLALAVGCSDADAVSPEQQRAVDVTLTQADLPAGFHAAKLGKDELQQMTDQLVDSTKKAQVTPANCVAPGAMVKKIDTATVGVMAATNAEVAVSESVQFADDVDGGVDLRTARREVTGDCGTVHVAVTAGPVKGSDIDVTYSVLDLPRGRADDVLVVESRSRTVNGSKSGSMDLLVGNALVDGYLVTVQMSPIDGSGGLDRAAFADVFAKAVAKAAK
ncbi:hypothetical protein [Gordonia neofelifaecis]|uniref:DUF5642 domain-containing protein n=1 Tax=Gordonia neofelifaecis NRRL B-59395 TaxID=644548 RepID=F1YL05_9ACTN|nr:hypothetical protein [Gordonia neofelifaecis]EGD54610.1 hypothetical protein SCNU_13548 [Gordonia neofelifaecis NRRL B-59395]